MNYQMGLYQPQMPMQMPMYQPQIQTPTASTTVYVDNFDQIKASDVPMDGKWVLFGKNDMSQVCAKAWTPQGQIQTILYKLDSEPNNVSTIPVKAENGAIFDEIKALKADMETLISKVDGMTNRNGGKKNESNANS